MKHKVITSKKIPASTCKPAEAAALEAKVSAEQSKPSILMALNPAVFALLARLFHYCDRINRLSALKK
jgi:hypothetical protein